MHDVDRIFGAFDSLSKLAQLRDLVFIARQADRRECGNCYFWMKSRDCPRERNVDGMTRGPNSGSVACDKFKITQSTLDLKKRRVNEAIAFAERHGLPVPPRSLTDQREGM